MASISNNDRVTTLRTVERAMAILELVAASAEPPRVRAVSRAHGLNLSTTYHLVNTLLAREYLARDGDGGLRIGPRVAILHAALQRGTGDLRQLRPFVEALAFESGETAYLTRWDGRAVVITAVAEGRESLRVTGLQVGFSGSEDRRASGRAVLAFLGPDELRGVTDRLFSGLAPAERGDRLENLESKLAAARVAGYATDEEDYETGICCVAAPYFNAVGRVVGSVTVSAPTVRRGPLHELVLPRVRAAARDMTRTLGGSDPSNDAPQEPASRETSR